MLKEVIFPGFNPEFLGYLTFLLGKSSPVITGYSWFLSIGITTGLPIYRVKRPTHTYTEVGLSRTDNGDKNNGLQLMIPDVLG